MHNDEQLADTTEGQSSTITQTHLVLADEIFVARSLSFCDNRRSTTSLSSSCPPPSASSFARCSRTG
jgi:hypothetical protein